MYINIYNIYIYKYMIPIDCCLASAILNTIVPACPCVAARTHYTFTLDIHMQQQHCTGFFTVYLPTAGQWSRAPRHA